MITDEVLIPGNYHVCGETESHRWCFHNIDGIKTISIMEFSDNPLNNGLKFLFEVPAFTFVLFLWLVVLDWENKIFEQFEQFLWREDDRK